MASLKKNVQVIHDGLVKNIAIVLGQAREKSRAAAFEYMQNRDKPVGKLKNQAYEDAEALVAWLMQLDALVKEVPEIPEDEPTPGSGG